MCFSQWQSNYVDVAFVVDWRAEEDGWESFLEIMGQPVMGYMFPYYNGSDLCGSNRKRHVFLVTMIVIYSLE